MRKEQACSLPGGQRGDRRPSTSIEGDPVVRLHVTYDATALSTNTIERAVKNHEPVIPGEILRKGPLGIAH